MNGGTAESGSRPRKGPWYSPREWEWIPHLLVCYVTLFVLFYGVAFVGIMFSAHGAELVLGAKPPPDSLYWAVLVAAVSIPVAGVYATVRVILNELRWRRTGDPRG